MTDLKIIRSKLFQKFPELIFGFSTKIGLERPAPFYFNLSFTVEDNAELVKQNREAFCNAMGLQTSQVATQKQIHSDIITIVGKPGKIGESDAMITTQKGIGLAVSSADCTPVFIYDCRQKIIAAVHSGWRGTEQRIVEKTIIMLKDKFNSSADDIFIYIGPAVSQKNYEVGKEVAEKFDSKFIKQVSGKLFLDVIAANVEMVLQQGIVPTQLEVSPLCSFEEKDVLHSYRRDGNLSGRSLGIIAMR